MCSIIKILLFFVYVVCFSGQICSQNLFADFEKSLLQLTRGERPKNLNNIVRDIFATNGKIEGIAASCGVCRIVANVVINARKDGTSKNELGNISKELCVLLSNFGYATCTGYIDIILDSVLYIIDHKSDLTAERVCALRFQTFNCEDPAYVPWSIDIPPGKSNHKSKRSEDEDKIDVVVHLTDIHVDPLYEPKSEALCDNILCCESVNGRAKSSANEAGYWGDYRACDMPWSSVENLLENINKKHPKIDRVYFTGDIISHQVWNTSKENNKVYIAEMLQKMKDYFEEIAVYPILGNHESHPTDFYPPADVTDSDLSIEWLFRFSAEQWSRWLPASTLETIRKGGYYTVLVKPGFRIVALNSNVCFTYNIWLIFEDNDPYGQLQWLSDTLLEAEKNQEFVHILSHVPPGDAECSKQWSHEFRRIVERFHETITGQFNGHTHLDELKVFFSMQDSDNVINVAFNGGSFTTYVGFNPTYRLYQIERSGNSIVNYEQWTYNLSNANENPTKNPDWFKLYSFEDKYRFRPRELQQFRSLVQNMSHDFTLIEEYRRLQGRNSSIVRNAVCDKKCLHDILCKIKTVEYDDLIECENRYKFRDVKTEL